MDKTDVVDFGRLMARMGIVFRRPIPDALAGEYFEALKGLTFPAVRFAVEHCIRNNERFPTPAQLRKVAYTPRQDRAPAATDPGPRDEEHAHVAFKLIQEIMADQPPPESRARLFWAMHARYPHYGWDDAARETEALVTKSPEESWREYHPLHLRLGIRCRCGLPNPMNPE